MTAPIPGLRSSPWSRCCWANKLEAFAALRAPLPPCGGRGACLFGGLTVAASGRLAMDNRASKNYFGVHQPCKLKGGEAASREESSQKRLLGDSMSKRLMIVALVLVCGGSHCPGGLRGRVRRGDNDHCRARHVDHGAKHRNHRCHDAVKQRDHRNHRDRLGRAHQDRLRRRVHGLHVLRLPAGRPGRQDRPRHAEQPVGRPSARVLR